MLFLTKNAANPNKTCCPNIKTNISQNNNFIAQIRDSQKYIKIVN
jgi:hypothetical protein